MALSDLIVGAESGGDPNATNPNSSAAGAGQFINSTWLSTIRQHRPDLVQGKSDDEILGMRSDPQLSREMTDAYASDNNAILSKNGLPVTPGNTYLAHFAGPGGAVKVLQADPNAPVESILGSAAVKANPFLAGMTAGGLQAWASRKMGGSAPQPQPVPASPASPANGPVAFPAQSAPIFPQATPQPQAAPDQSMASLPIDSLPQAPPIFYAPRRSPDLSALSAALRGGLIFGKS